MDGQLIGLVAVILGMGIPLGALYTYYRVRKLRSEERLAAIARGAAIPVEPELNQAARSRRAGILLVSGAIGYILTFGLIAQIQADRDIWTAAALGKTDICGIQATPLYGELAHSKKAAARFNFWILTVSTIHPGRNALSPLSRS